MLCEKCGNKLPDNATICSKCGHRTVSRQDKNTNSMDEKIKTHSFSFSEILPMVLSVFVVICLFQKWVTIAAFKYNNVKRTIWEFITMDFRGFGRYLELAPQILMTVETIILMLALIAAVICELLYLVCSITKRDYALTFGKIGMIIATAMSLSSIVVFFIVDIMDGVSRGILISNGFSPTIFPIIAFFLGIITFIYMRKTSKKI